jgi:L-threonylcarbamoyladenylate synthase
VSAALPSPDAIARAVAGVRAGGLIAYPTETVWGLGADARAAGALARLRRWKGRGPSQPLAILVEGIEALPALGFEVGAAASRLAAAYWPGPLTLVLPCRETFADGVARGDGAVGVRCSPHPVAAALARALAREGAGPVTATSLNRSGEPPARTRREAAAHCSGPDAPALVDAGPDAGGGPPSTVVDLAGAAPVVLRYGALAAEALDPILRGADPDAGAARESTTR